VSWLRNSPDRRRESVGDLPRAPFRDGQSRLVDHVEDEAVTAIPRRARRDDAPPGIAYRAPDLGNGRRKRVAQDAREVVIGRFNRDRLVRQSRRDTGELADQMHDLALVLGTARKLPEHFRGDVELRQTERLPVVQMQLAQKGVVGKWLAFPFCIRRKANARPLLQDLDRKNFRAGRQVVDG
jgi:hypothetical protein